MHTMYQMYRKHQSVGLHRKKNKQALSSNGGQEYLNYFKRGDEQSVFSIYLE